MTKYEAEESSITEMMDVIEECIDMESDSVIQNAAKTIGIVMEPHTTAGILDWIRQGREYNEIMNRVEQLRKALPAYTRLSILLWA